MMKIDDLSNINYLKTVILSKITDKELIEKVKHSSELGFLRGVHYCVENPVHIDYDKINGTTY